MNGAMWPVLKREYKTRFFSKGFWISTALFPLLTIGVTVLPSRLAMRTKSSPEPIRVVDSIGGFYPALQQAVKAASDADVPKFELEDARGRNVEQIRRDLNALAEKNKIQGYVIVDEKALKESQLTVYAQNPSGAIDGDIRGIFADAIRALRLKQLGADSPDVLSAVKRVEVDVQKATNDPSKRQDARSAFFFAFGLVFFIYFSLIFYGVYVLRGVLEEKSNRIVEVIVAAVKPFDLMIGKILGIGAVGLTQIAIWLGFALLLSSPQIAGMLAISPNAIPSVNGMLLAMFPVYFVLGYFLFATIYAGIGSIFNSEEDAQQMVSSASMLLVIPMIFLGPVVKNPNGTLAVVLSLIPFFSPILMYLRIAVQQPPMWQIGLSILIMTVTIFVMIWLVSKIYRVGILMYGKKPTIPEIARWLRYT
jgi:ABC-2 type transport system permease protein